MRKHLILSMAVLFSCMLFLAACGEKSKESVVGKLEKNVEDMDGYKVTAEMKMSTGQEDQVYGVDIWFKQDDYYRVSLSNPEDEKGSQVILKNDDGVFVLTPSLNKSFKFQTDWPHNSSQPYLYQSLVKDVIADEDAEFSTTESNYVFLTKTNYQSNNNLPFQEIHFDKKTYAPVLVKVMDKDKQPLVEVTFDEFDMKPTFEEDDFKLVEEDMDKEEATNDENEKDETSQEEGTSVSKEAGEEDEELEEEPLSVVFPLESAGAELLEKKEVSLEDGERVIMTFGGERNFTLVQEKFDVVPTMAAPKEVEGDIVNLGFTIGAMSDNAIEWSYDGVDFYLASDDLTKDELVEVAQSVTGKEVK